jgi:hypothetical protein
LKVALCSPIIQDAACCIQITPTTFSKIKVQFEHFPAI